MLESLFIALTILLEPEATAPTLVVRPTCIQLAALISEADVPCAQSKKSSTSSQLIAELLKRWEASANRQRQPSRSEREEFRRSIRDAFNEHAVVAAELFFGDVSSRQLEEAFEWRIVDRSADAVSLEAVPKDEMERLFYRSLSVTLDLKTGAANRLIIVGRNQTSRIVWKEGRRDADSSITLVNVTSDVPPSPIRLVRTADLRNE